MDNLGGIGLNHIESTLGASWVKDSLPQMDLLKRSDYFPGKSVTTGESKKGLCLIVLACFGWRRPWTTPSGLLLFATLSCHMSYFANPRILYTYVSHVYSSDDIPVDVFEFHADPIFKLYCVYSCWRFVRFQRGLGNSARQGLLHCLHGFWKEFFQKSWG